MNLNRVEWTKAQELLVKLVQILTPLADRAEQSSGAVSFLNKRFFIPPSHSDSDSQVFRFRYPVSLLKTALHSAKTQVSEWIEQLPHSETEEPAPIKKEEAPLPKALLREKSLPVPKGERSVSPESKREPRPLPLQAQRLIHQVRDAIGALCTSSNVNDPKAAPLREALKRLKPLIDEIIEAVSHDGMHSADQEQNPQPRLPIPPSPREHLIKKWLPSPLNGAPKMQDVELKPNRLERKREKEGEEEPSRAGPKSEKEKILQPISQKPDSILFPAPSRKDLGPRPNDRIALPGAPFAPETRSLTPGRKKKKRKGFWFREEKEDPTNS